MKAPPAFPAVGMIQCSTPNSFALEMAMLIPRALKEPVGLVLSSFIRIVLILSLEESFTLYKEREKLQVN